jgi:hypothetical protein
VATLRVVDLVVRAHDGTSAGTNGVRKWPKVQLVKSLVIDVRADRVNLFALECTRRAEVLLLVQDVVLRASNDAGILDTLDGVGNSNAGEIWVGGEAFPVALNLR